MIMGDYVSEIWQRKKDFERANKTIAQALKIGDNIKSINFSNFADIEAFF